MDIPAAERTQVISKVIRICLYKSNFNYERATYKALSDLSHCSQRSCNGRVHFKEFVLGMFIGQMYLQCMIIS